MEVMVSGNSGRVTISGRHSPVVLDHVASIDAPGHHNQIVYGRGRNFNIAGSGNQVPIRGQEGNPQMDKSGLNNEIIRR